MFSPTRTNVLRQSKVHAAARRVCSFRLLFDERASVSWTKVHLSVPAGNRGGLRYSCPRSLKQPLSHFSVLWRRLLNFCAKKEEKNLPCGQIYLRLGWKHETSPHKETKINVWIQTDNHGITLINHYGFKKSDIVDKICQACICLHFGNNWHH